MENFPFRKEKILWILTAGFLSLVWLFFIFLPAPQLNKNFSVEPLAITQISPPLAEINNKETKEIEIQETTEITEKDEEPLPIQIAGAITSLIDESRELILDKEKSYLVTRVIDGDTIDVEGVGRIRMIGVDTPETVDPRKPVQCFGVEASNKTKEMLLGQKVYLEIDKTQGDRDKYGRALRYVYLENGILYNQWLIENGFAYEYTYNIAYELMEDFKFAQNEARLLGKGLWGADACSNTEILNSKIISSQSSDCNIKGNINSAGEKIYHMPGGEYYEATKIDEARKERWFCSEQEALSAGWRKSLK